MFNKRKTFEKEITQKLLEKNIHYDLSKYEDLSIFKFIEINKLLLSKKTLVFVSEKCDK